MDDGEATGKLAFPSPAVTRSQRRSSLFRRRGSASSSARTTLFAPKSANKANNNNNNNNNNTDNNNSNNNDYDYDSNGAGRGFGDDVAGDARGAATPTAVYREASAILGGRTPGQELRRPRDPVGYDPFAEERPARRRLVGPRSARKPSLRSSTNDNINNNNNNNNISNINDAKGSEGSGHGVSQGADAVPGTSSSEFEAGAADPLMRLLRLVPEGPYSDDLGLQSRAQPGNSGDAPEEPTFARVLAAASLSSTSASSSSTSSSTSSSSTSSSSTSSSSPHPTSSSPPACADPSAAPMGYESVCHSLGDRAERNTWRLVHCVYPDRVSDEADGVHARRLALSRARASRCVQERWSPQAAVLALLEADPASRELRSVASWLEAVAEEGAAAEAEDASWTRTAAGGYVKPGASLDPDATAREGAAALHPADREADAVLMRGVWSLVRAGKFAAARELCRRCGQNWRASSLGGALLAHDPPLAGDPEGAPSGNVFRNVWREAAAGIARDASLDPHERAVYAVSCGLVEPALPVCATWEDRLWVHVSALLDARVQDELSQLPVGHGDAPAVPPAAHQHQHQQQPSSSSETETEGGTAAVTRSLEVLLAEAEAAAARDGAGVEDRLREVQCLMILGREGEAIARLAEWCEAEGAEAEARHRERLQQQEQQQEQQQRRQWSASGSGEVRAISVLATAGADPRPPPLRLARFAAHLALYFRSLGLDLDAEPSTAGSWHRCVRCYVDDLARRRRAGLVAAYAARLPAGEQIPAYASFLERVKVSSERGRCLELARAAGLDARAISAAVVSNIWTGLGDGDDAGRAGQEQKQQKQHQQQQQQQQQQHGVPVARSGELPAADEERIRAIEWLCFDPRQRGLAVSRARSLLREFVLHGRHASAELLSRAVPRGAAEELEASLGEDPASAGGDVGDAVREYLDLTAYLEAVSSFARWDAVRSAAPELNAAAIHGDGGASGDGGGYALRTRKAAAEAEHARAVADWRRSVEECALDCVSRIRALLAAATGFLPGGLEPFGAETSGDPGARELHSLRSRCVPVLVTSLCGVLSGSGDHAGCVSVARLVADETVGLIQSFTKPELQGVLSVIASSAAVLAERKALLASSPGGAR